MVNERQSRTRTCSQALGDKKGGRQSIATTKWSANEQSKCKELVVSSGECNQDCKTEVKMARAEWFNPLQVTGSEYGAAVFFAFKLLKRFVNSLPISARMTATTRRFCVALRGYCYQPLGNTHRNRSRQADPAGSENLNNRTTVAARPPESSQLDGMLPY